MIYYIGLHIPCQKGNDTCAFEFPSYARSYCGYFKKCICVTNENPFEWIYCEKKSENVTMESINVKESV